MKKTEDETDKDPQKKYDIEFTDDHMKTILEHFKVPLEKAGLSVSAVDIFEEWYNLLEYAIKYLAPSSTPYLQTWHQVFNSSKCSEEYWNVLLVAELIFCLPVCTAKLERSFSLLKRIKTDGRASLNKDHLQNLIRICGKDSPLQSLMLCLW